ncbi:MAG: LytTR family DNA-binding domain-containing protein [Acetatifactor sp.]|nr:LytTR family DNA-binding domain-containing protein [Acetatifactor sp.]
MPDTSGFSIAEWRPQNYPGISYVVLTGCVDFAARSYDYEPLDFLTKPIDLMRLRKTLERYESRSQQPAPDYSRERIAVETSIGFVLLAPSEISYIGKERREVKLYCHNGETYVVRHSLDELEGIFSDFGFFRIHQSCLAPLSNIVSVRPSRFGKTYEAVLSDQTCLPVSRDKYQKLRSFLISRGVQFI